MAATRIRGEATSAVEHQRDKNEWPERPVADVTLVRWFRNRILAGMRRNAAAAFDTAGPTGDINVYKWVDIAFTCMRKKSQRCVEAGEREGGLERRSSLGWGRSEGFGIAASRDG